VIPPRHRHPKFLGFCKGGAENTHSFFPTTTFRWQCFPILGVLFSPHQHRSRSQILPHVHRPAMKCLIPVFSALVLLAAPIAADTNYTACDPTKSSSCPPDPGFSSSTTVINFEEPYPDGLVTLFSANSITRDSNGLHITINSIGEEPFVVTDGMVLVRLF